MINMHYYDNLLEDIEHILYKTIKSNCYGKIIAHYSDWSQIKIAIGTDTEDKEYGKQVLCENVYLLMYKITEEFGYTNMRWQWSNKKEYEIYLIIKYEQKNRIHNIIMNLINPHYDRNLTVEKNDTDNNYFKWTNNRGNNKCMPLPNDITDKELEELKQICPKIKIIHNE